MLRKRIIAILNALIFFTALSSCNKKEDINPPVNEPVVPELSIYNVSQPRVSVNSTMQFYVNLNKTTTNAVSVDYALVDETAVSSKDYQAASGTLTIPANQKQATIDVQIKGDPTNLRQDNLQFIVQLSNPKFCTISNSSAKGTILTEDGTYLPTDNNGYTTPLSYPEYTLAWSDEFSVTNLDLTTWNQEIGNGSGGWGNNELEYYTNNLKNTFISNGNLIIEARKESMNGFNYSSEE